MSFYKKKTIAVLIENGATAGYLIPRLKEQFNGAVHVITINSRDIRHKDVLDRTNVLFIPGVSRASDAYRNSLGERGGKAIKRWVREGGIAVGLCQGAYLLTRKFEYADKFSGQVKIIHPSSGLFPGVARGPVREYTNFSEVKNPFIDHAVAKLEFTDGAKGAACYSHGPWLEISEQVDPAKYRIIARFAEVTGNPIAIASRRYGKGKAVFCSVVPEISGIEMARSDARLTRKNTPQAEHLRTGILFAQKLAAHEAERELVWNRLMAELRIRPA